MYPVIFLVVLIGLSVTGQNLATQAFYKLGPEDQLKTINGLKGYSLWQGLPTGLLLALPLAAWHYASQLFWPVLAGVFALLLVTKIKTMRYLARRFEELSLPASYRRTFFLGALAVLLLDP